MSQPNYLGCLIKPSSITISFTTGPRTVLSDHPSFNQVKEALQQRRFDELLPLLDVQKAITAFSGNNIEIANGVIRYRDQELNGYLADKVIRFMQEDFDWEPLALFLDNLLDNPSSRARSELYKFLETEDLPLTDDGHFLAYKAVNQDWTDHYSGKIDNSIGNVVEMHRNEVDDDFGRGCSHGLHAGSIEYVRGFGRHDSRTLIVKINPRDVVAIPSEDVRKLRTCRYEVLSEMDCELVFPMYSRDGSSSFGRSQDSVAREEPRRTDIWDDEDDNVSWAVEADLSPNVVPDLQPLTRADFFSDEFIEDWQEIVLESLSDSLGVSVEEEDRVGDLYRARHHLRTDLLGILSAEGTRQSVIEDVLNDVLNKIEFSSSIGGLLDALAEALDVEVE